TRTLRRSPGCLLPCGLDFRLPELVADERLAVGDLRRGGNEAELASRVRAEPGFVPGRVPDHADVAAASTSVSTREANGHHPEVSSSSTWATPSVTRARCSSPMSTTEMPLSRQ